MLAGFDLQEYYRHLHLSRNIRFLYLNRLLSQIGTGMLVIFTALFFYEKFNDSFTAVALIFAFAYGVFGLLTPVSAKLIERIGMKRMLITASLFFPLTTVSLVFWDYNPTLVLAAYLLFGALYRLLYWTPYHVDVAKFTEHNNRGKQLSLLSNLSEVALSFTPLVAGVIIALYGFEAVFIVVSVFTLISVIPLFYIEDVVERYSFGYIETFRQIFKKGNRPMLLAYIGDGVQSSIRIVVWPIFIFSLLDGRYIIIGLITTLTVLVLIVLRFLVGELADRWNRKVLLTIGSVFATTGWLVKVFIETGFQVFVADTYHRLGRVVHRLSFDVAMYDQAADNGHYVDEYTVLKEVVLNVSRVLLLLISILVVALYGIPVMFFLAAGATLLMVALGGQEARIQ